MTTSVNAPLSQAEQTFYDLVWSPMLQLGENWLEASVPFLALPIIRTLDEEVLKVITDWTFQQIRLLIDVTAIKLINSAHQTAYDSASLQLKIISKEKGPNSDEYKKSLAAAALALSQFTRFSK